MPDPVGVALIGAGNVVTALYLPLLTSYPQLRIVNVYDINRAAARLRADALGARVASSLEDAVGDKGVSAVFVCVPKEAHREVVLAALASGRHVLCEKPLGRTGAEALELWRAAERSGLAHMVNFPYRFRPGPAAARRLLRSGVAGRIYQLHGTMSQGGWFTASGGRADERPDANDWRFGPAGGVVRDLGPHVVDFSAELGPIQWAQAWTKTFSTAQVSSEDAAGFTLGFANGSVAHLLTSRHATGHREHFFLEVAGSHGSIAFDRAEARLWTRDEPAWRVVPASPLKPFLAEFHALITGREVDVPTFRDGAYVSLALDAVLRSAASGMVETVRSPE